MDKDIKGGGGRGKPGAPECASFPPTVGPHPSRRVSWGWQDHSRVDGNLDRALAAELSS